MQRMRTHCTFRLSASITIAASAVLLLACAQLPVRALDSGSSSAEAGKAAPKSKKDSKNTSAASKSDSSKSRSKTQEPVIPPRVAVIFPVDTSAGADAAAPAAAGSSAKDQLGDILTDVAQSRLTASGRFHSVLFRRSLPTVRRALNENSLSAAEVDKPTGTDLRVRKLTTLAGYDLALVMSIDSYEYDTDKNQVSIVMSARLIDLAGKPRGAGINGTSPAKAPEGAKEIDLASKLARDLAEQMMTSLLAPPKTAAPVPAGGTDPAK